MDEVSLHPHLHLQSLVLVMLAILTNLKWNLRRVLIFIALVGEDTEDFLKYLLVFYISPFENSLLISTACV